MKGNGGKGERDQEVMSVELKPVGDALWGLKG